MKCYKCKKEKKVSLFSWVDGELRDKDCAIFTERICDECINIIWNNI